MILIIPNIVVYVREIFRAGNFLSHVQQLRELGNQIVNT